MDPEVTNMLNALAEEGFNKWRDNTTDDQKAQGLEQLNKFKTDEEYRNTEIAEFTQRFNDADANKDGVLNRDEYLVCNKASEARELEKGNWAMNDDEYAGRFYAAANMITPATDGITMADMMQAITVIMAKNDELKAAAGL